MVTHPTASNHQSVHPHARGENKRLGFRARMIDGSPPRSWGKCAPTGIVTTTPRFTPTLVGKMSCAAKHSHHMAVHPHARGENDIQAIGSFKGCGSPPRSWGKSVTPQRTGVPQRFTPTLVGKISESTRSRCADSVHPHARGENVGYWVSPRRNCGSPPRSWGK